MLNLPEVGSPARHGQCHQTGVARQQFLAYAPYVVRQVGAALHDPLGRIGRLWPTHRKNAACAGIPQSLDGSVRVLRGIHDMRPIDERCDPAIKRREPPDQVGGVNIFRPHDYAELEEVIGKILCRAPVRA